MNLKGKTFEYFLTLLSSLRSENFKNKRLERERGGRFYSANCLEVVLPGGRMRNSCYLKNKISICHQPFHFVYKDVLDFSTLSCSVARLRGSWLKCSNAGKV